MFSTRVRAVLTLSIITAIYSSGSMAYTKGKTEVELGMEVSGYKYNETIENQDTGKDDWFMTDTGGYIGVAGSFAYYGDLFLKFDTVLKAGSVHYESNGTGSADDIVDYIVDTRGLVGINFCRGDWRITPYTGLGFRYLYDSSYQNGRLTDAGAVGYDRESNYIYSPFGVELRKRLNSQWDVGGALEFDVFWHGFQESHLEQPGHTIATIVNKQNEGYGFRASIKATRELTNSRKLVVEPYYRYWSINSSDLAVSIRTTNPPTVTIIQEPDNTTNEFGVKVGILF